MNIITFLFKLVQQFSPMDDVEYHKLSTKGNDWYMGIMTKEEEPSNKYLAMMKKHGNEWYTALGLGIAYIFAAKWVADQLNPKKFENDEY